jgi:hypothetical protein
MRHWIKNVYLVVSLPFALFAAAGLYYFFYSLTQPEDIQEGWEPTKL